MSALPMLPQLKELELSDKPLVDAALAACPPEQSELTFTNLFIWRHAYGVRLGMHGDNLCIFAWRADPEESFVFPPIGAAASGSVAACLELLAGHGHAARLCRATRADIARLGLDSPGFTLAEDRDNADYVYDVRDLTRLAGAAYRDKRGHIVTFEQLNPFFEYRRLTPGLVGQCQELQDAWCDEKHCDLVTSMRAEARAVKEVLAAAEQLRVTGGVILVDGRVEAFTLGELMAPDTVVIHIEKANGSMHGLFQVINQQFLAHEWQGAQFVNREQDLGVPGLRQAKLSYSPHHLVEKYTVKPA